MIMRLTQLSLLTKVTTTLSELVLGIRNSLAGPPLEFATQDGVLFATADGVYFGVTDLNYK